MLPYDNPMFCQLIEARQQMSRLAEFIPAGHSSEYENIAMMAEIGLAIECFNVDVNTCYLRFMHDRSMVMAMEEQNG